MYRNGEKCKAPSESMSANINGDHIYLSRADCFNTLNLHYTNESLKQIHKVEARQANSISKADENKL